MTCTDLHARFSRRTTLPALARSLRWTLGAVGEAAPGLGLTLLLLRLAHSASPALTLLLTRNLVNAVLAGAGQGAGGFRQALPWAAALAGSLLLSEQILWRVQWPLTLRLSQRLEHLVEGRRLAKASRLPLLFFEEGDSYNKLSRSESPQVKIDRFFGAILDLVGGLVSILSVSALFLAVSPWLTLALLAVTAPQSLLNAELNRRWLRFTYAQTEEQRRVGYVDELLTGRHEQKELRVFGLAEPLMARWRAMRSGLHRALMAERMVLARYRLGSEGLGFVVELSAVMAVAWRLVGRGLDAGAFVSLFQAVGQISRASSTISYNVGELHSMSGEIGYIREFLDLPEEEPGARTQPFPNPLRAAIRLEGVSFQYPGASAPVLSDLMLEIKAGERVALVGENGAGKSTLAKLILGLYRPTAGRITADGADYRAIDPESLTRGVAAVFQDYYNFAFSAAQSIGVGAPETFGGPDGLTPDSQRVRAAAERGGAHDFIEALSRGYETRVGHLYDGSVGLSGGQWQRIAISRAFMRDPALIILDEPTAALDPKAEAEVYARFTEMLQGRTGLLISHRLGSARLADRILVQRGGQIVEEGRHEELLKLGGQYAHMWEEQAQWYR